MTPSWLTDLQPCCVSQSFTVRYVLPTATKQISLEKCMLLCDMCVNTSPTRYVVIYSKFSWCTCSSLDKQTTRRRHVVRTNYIHGTCAHIATTVHTFREHFCDRILSRGLLPFKPDLNLQNFHSCLCYRINTQ